MSNVTTQAWWVYIVICIDGSYYTGITKNVSERIRKHNLGKGAKYTNSRKPVKLAYTEKKASKSDALKREYEIKQLTKSQKQKLLSETNLKT